MVLHEFRAGFKEHQHPQWAQHYIDCDAVIQGFADAGLSTRSIQKATVDNPISARRHDALPHPLSVLQAEAGRALSFCGARIAECATSLDALQLEMNSIGETEAVAGLGIGAFADQRHVMQKRFWRLWIDLELLTAFGSLNCEAAAQLANHAHGICGEGVRTAFLETGPMAGLQRVEVNATPTKRRVLDYVALHFFEKDQTAAIEFLCHIDRRAASQSTIFMGGFIAGFCLCFAVGVINVAAASADSRQLRGDDVHLMFFTYRPAGLVALAIWLWGLNVVVFEACVSCDFSCDSPWMLHGSTVC